MDKTDPTSLLVYANRTATAPKYSQNISHKTNVLDDFGSTESDSEDGGPVTTRRGSRQSRHGSRKTSGFSAKENVSGRNSSLGARWKVVGSDFGEIVTVTAEQMTNAEKAAIDAGLNEDVLIENAGNVFLYLADFSAGHRRGGTDFSRD